MHIDWNSADYYLELSQLFSIVMVVSIEVIGVVQWLKHFLPAKAGCRTYATVSFITLLPCAIMNVTLVPAVLHHVFNIVFLGLAVSQIAYDAVLKGIPTLISGFFDRVSSSMVVSKGGSN